MIRLQLTAGTTTINLQADGYTVLDGYYPRTGTDPDGWVTEDITVFFRGAGYADAIRSINRVLEVARNSDDPNEQAYLEFAPTEGGSLWRAKVRNGTVNLDSRLNRTLKENKVQFGLALERENCWNGAELQIPLSNGNGTNNTAGLNVVNYGDGSGAAPLIRHMHADVAGSAVSGDLPARMRLEMTYTADAGNTTPGLSGVWVGQSWTNPAGFAYWYTLQDGGIYLTMPSSPETFEQYKTRDLTAAHVSAMAGQPMKAVLRARIGGWHDMLHQVNLLSGATRIYSGAPVRVNMRVANGAREIGDLRIPPKKYTLGAMGALTVQLRCSHAYAAAIQEGYWDLILLPTSGFMHARYPVVASGARMVLDGINQVTYQDNGTGANRLMSASEIGSFIELYPGRANRLYFILDSNSFNFTPIADYLTVKLFARPRRLAL